MKKLLFVSEKQYRCFQLPNGKLIDVYSCKYDAKVDLENETYMPFSNTKEYELCSLPTFNDLVKKGIVKEVSCIERTYDIEIKKTSDTNKVIAEFKKNGFNVTKKAIIHNYNAWRNGYKSGYRDERRNYHLFTPCGGNPLSFRATTLHPKCADWQTTYEW